MEQPKHICQLDIDDLSVPLTKERALGLQTELWQRLATPQFQDQLEQCKEQGLEPLEFRKVRQRLVLDVQSEVLPKYGYQADASGVAEMMKEFDKFVDDPEVSANRDAIDQIIGKNKDHRKSERNPLQLEASALRLQLGLPYPSPAAPMVVVPEHPLLGARRVRSASPSRPPNGWRPDAALHVQSGRPSSKSAPPATRQWMQTYQELLGWKRRFSSETQPPVEIDLNDIQVPLTRPRILALQKELWGCYQSRDFQIKVRKYAEKYGAGSLEFRKERLGLVLDVQGEILQRYGFEAGLKGAAALYKSMGETFPHDAEIAANAEAIDELSGKTWGSVSRQDKVAIKQSISPWAKALPQPWYEMAVRRVRAEDGYWVVTGGKKHGGLLVRLGESTAAKQMPTLLAIGAVVKEVQRCNGRLCYELVSGIGPNYGWVSLELHGTHLLQRYEGDIHVLSHMRCDPKRDSKATVEPKVSSVVRAGNSEQFAQVE